MSAALKPGPGARLHPLDLPNDTDLRFYLLIGTVLAASLYLIQLAYLGVPSIQAQIRALADTCGGLLLLPSADAWPLYNQCSAGFSHQQAAWIVIGVAVLCLISWAQYRIYPSLKIRRAGLKKLTDGDFPGVLVALERLVRELGVGEPAPTILWNPSNQQAMALAFGSGRQRYVLLSKGLLLAFFVRRPVFQAIVLHELAHFKNRDVNKTHLALAFWRTYAYAAFIPLIFALWRGRLPWVFDVAWRMAVIAAIVLLMRNALIRTRELYADAQAHLWDMPASNVAQAVAAQPRTTPSRWQYFRQVHPTVDERLRAIEEPHRIMRIGFWDLFGAGIAVAAGLPGVRMLASLIFQATPLQWASEFLMALVVVGPAAALIALAIWRGRLAAAQYGLVVRDGMPLALGFGLGLWAGRPLAIAADTLTEPTMHLSAWQAIFISVLWGLLLLGTLWIFAKWTTWVADAWSATVIQSESPRAVLAVTSGLAGLLFALCFVGIDLAWLILEFFPHADGIQALLGGFAAVSLRPIYWIIPIGLCALPLAASASDVSGERHIWQRGLREGIITLGLYCLFLVAIQIAQRSSWVPPSINLDRATIYTLQSALAVLLQAIATLTVAQRLETRLAPLSLMVGALIGVGMTTIGLWFNHVALGDHFNLHVYGTVTSINVNLGFLIAFLLLLLTRSAFAEER